MNVVIRSIVGVACLCVTAAGEREASYYVNRCLPLAREFLSRNQIATDLNFTTNLVSHWQVHFEKETDVYLSRLMLTNRFAFMFIGRDSINGVTHFFDKGSGWNSKLMDPKNERQMREIAARKNMLNDSSALALAKRYFHLQGHDQANFHPPRFKQMVWAWGVPSRRIALPFFEAEWARRDVKVPIEENESIYPSVTIIVSGLESNLVVYSKTLLPHQFGADWEPKANLNEEKTDK